jgi:hypothetical protein
VYNSTAHPMKAITLAGFCETSLKFTEEIPISNILWKPNLHITKYKAWYYVNVIFLHLVPGLLIDGLLKISGKKPLYVNITCIIYVHIYILLMMLYPPGAVII